MSYRHIILIVCIVMVWGFNSVAIKLGLNDFPPLFMTVLRFIVVATISVPFSKIKKAQLVTLIPLSFTFGFMHFSLLFLGTSFTDAGTSAVIVQLGTPIAVLISTFFFKDSLSRAQIAGLFISFMGVVLISGSPTLSSGWAVAILLCSATGWALSNIIIKRSPPVNPITLTGWIALLAIPQVGVLSWFFENDQLVALLHSSWKGWFGVIYSAVGASILAYSSWYYLLRKYHVNIVMPWSLLTPAFAVITGCFVLGDEMNSFKLLGTTLIVSGTVICSLTHLKRGSPPLKK